MTDKRNIEDRIKESFEGMNHKAPQGIWENLNKKLVDGDTLNEKVKESFEGLQGSAPEQVWEEVNKQLNIDRAWRGVKGMLIRRTIWRKTRRIAALLLLFLLIGWGSSHFFAEQSTVLHFNERKTGRLINEEDKQEYKTTSPTLTENRKQQAVQDENFNQNKEEQQDLKISKKILVAEAPPTGTNAAIKITKGNPFQAKKSALLMAEKGTDKEDKKDPIVFEQMPTQPLRLIVITNSYNIAPIEISYVGDSIFKEKNKSQRFEAGLIYSYNKTTLFNNETRRSFDQRSLVSSEASYAGSLGIAGTYHFSHKHSLTALGYLQSRTKQHYKTYLEGRYTEKNIMLDFGKVAMAYQHNFLSSIPFIENRFTIKAGLYYSWLKKGIVAYNGMNYSVEDNYVNSDWGLLLQAGQEINKNRFVLAYGLNIERGLKNIFAGDGKTPADFDRTTTFNIGGYVSTRYKF